MDNKQKAALADSMSQAEIQIASLQQQIGVRDARIAALTAANADLTSRLDELRRVFGRNAIPLGGQHVSIPGRLHNLPWQTLGRTPVTGETASDCLAEHAGAKDEPWPVGSVGAEWELSRNWTRDLSDPAGGG